MLIKEETDSMMTWAFAERSSAVETMASQSPAFFTETLPAAFRIDNPIASMIVSEATSHISDRYDENYYPSTDLGQYEGTEFEPQLLVAKNANHMQAIKTDIERENKDRELLGNASGETFARMVAGIISPDVLLPGGAVIKTAKGISVAKSAVVGAAAGGAALAVSESALQMTQQTRPMEESTFAIGGGVILGGLLGGAVSKLSRSEFTRISKQLEKDLEAQPELKDGDPFTNGVTEQDLSAARTQKLTLNDLTLSGKATQFASSATRIVNPFNRLLNSPFKSTRETFAQMAEIPMKLNLNKEGKTLGDSAETELKLYDKGKAVSYDALSKNFTAYKKREKVAGSKPMTNKEFRERVSYALRNGDEDANGISEITQTAKTIRAEVFEPMKKEAIKLGLLPEDVASKFSDTYLTRMWSKERLLADRDGAMNMFRTWAGRKVDDMVTQTKKQLDEMDSAIQRTGELSAKVGRKMGDLEQELTKVKNLHDDGYDEYIDEVAEELYQKMTTLGDNEVPDFLAPLTRGPLKEKLLDIEDNFASPYLENDIAAIVNYYTQQMGADIALTRRFGRADLKDQFKALDDEFSEAVKAAGADPKLVKKLTKEYKSNRKDLEGVRDLLRGTFKKSKTPDGMLEQSATVIRDLNYMRSLGGVLISSLSDAFRVTMVHGMDRAFGDLLTRLEMPKELRTLAKDELREMGFLWESVLSSRMSTIADISDPFARGTALTRTTGYMSSSFSRMTQINTWNDVMKSWAATTTQTRVLKNIKNMASGKLQGKEMEYFAYLGIDKDVAKTISEQFAKHGQKKGRAYIAGIKNWDETPAAEYAARIYKSALRKEADTIITTKGVSDVPLVANHPIGSMIFQFKSFLFAANQRVMMRGLQDADAKTAMGAITMVAGGMIVAAIKQAEREASGKLTGRESGQSSSEWTMDKWLAEGIDRSGLFPVLWEANNIYEKAGGYGITQAMGQAPASRFASRNIAGAMFGPTIGTVADLGSIVGLAFSPLTGRDVAKADIYAIRKTMPFQNSVGFKFLFDAIEGKVNEELDAK